MAHFDKLPTTIFGLNNQKQFEKYINTIYKNVYYNGTIYNEVDFCSDYDKVIIEFKSRNINHNEWPTFFLNKCKIDYYLENYRNKKYKFYVYYLYKDGLFKVKINRDIMLNSTYTKIYSYQESNRNGKITALIDHDKLEFVMDLMDYKSIILNNKKN
jgi:hypothetical protein